MQNDRIFILNDHTHLLHSAQPKTTYNFLMGIYYNGYNSILSKELHILHLAAALAEVNQTITSKMKLYLLVLSSTSSEAIKLDVLEGLVFDSFSVYSATSMKFPGKKVLVYSDIVKHENKFINVVSKEEKSLELEGLNIMHYFEGEEKLDNRNIGLISNKINLNYNKNKKTNIKVKICGIRTAEAALCAAKNGADFIGLILVEKSKRFVDLETAKRIIDIVRGKHKENKIEHNDQKNMNLFDQRIELFESKVRPSIVGVFRNQPLSYVNYVGKYLDLDYIQLHGDENFEYAQSLFLPAIKVFHMDESYKNDYDKYYRMDMFEFPLLDAKQCSGVNNNNSGGLGLVFDWSYAVEIMKKYKTIHRQSIYSYPFILAGGLTPENVQEAVRLTTPWCVDVSSGVETDGCKDNTKIELFISRAKGFQSS